MSKSQYSQNFSLVSIRLEMKELEDSMRELFYLPKVNDDVVAIYNKKLKRYEKLQKIKQSFYSEEAS